MDGETAVLSDVGALLRRTGYSVTEAESGQAALDAAREDRPDVVVIGIDLPDGSGFEIYRELRDAFGQSLRVVFLSPSQPNPNDEVAALLLGADDYVTKPVVPDVVVARVRRLADRDNGVPPHLAADLTRREFEVLKLLVSGLREPEIALDLCIAPKTVAKHIEHILGKLGVHSRAQAVAEAMRCGVVPERELRLVRDTY